MKDNCDSRDPGPSRTEPSIAEPACCPYQRTQDPASEGNTKVCNIRETAIIYKESKSTIPEFPYGICYSHIGQPRE